MRSKTGMRLAILLLLISCVSGCADIGKPAPVGTPSIAVKLPPPPKYMAACVPSGVKVGDPPNQAFDAEHAAFKTCSRSGLKARSWYAALRQRYAAPGKK